MLDGKGGLQSTQLSVLALAAEIQARQFRGLAHVLQGITSQGPCPAYPPLWSELLKAGQPGVTPGSCGAMLLA